MISDITGGSVGAGTINRLLDTLDVMSLLHVDVGADGNLYVTYDSGGCRCSNPSSSSHAL